MILSDRMIKAAIKAGEIVIDPFDPKSLGTNSYDVHLGPMLLTYTRKNHRHYYYPLPLDCKEENPITRHEIQDDGFVLNPGVLYLASTVEYTETYKHVPFVDGKSSIGRLGIFIHCTAGRGDIGFTGHWTLEIAVVEPIRVYAGMPIGQLIYFESGAPDVSYNQKKSSKYNDGRNPDPQPSRMWKNFPR